MESRKEREKKFHDHAFSENTRTKEVSKFYSIVGGRDKYFTNLLIENCKDKKILVYGCGKDSFAFQLAKNSTNVTGIDISPVAIKISRERAAKEQVSNKVRFLEMDAEYMSFPNNSFDVICGSGILHHLNLKRSLKEISRVLKPNGRAFFVEPLGHNPAINYFRNRTPHLRTKDEHPITINDITLFRKNFGRVETKFFYFITLIAIMIRGLPFFQSTVNVLEKIDNYLFKVLPTSKKMAWFVVISLYNPKKIS